MTCGTCLILRSAVSSCEFAARLSGLAFGLALAVRPDKRAAFRPGTVDFPATAHLA